MNKNWRFVFQENMYWAPCEPCTAAKFSQLVRSHEVAWTIGMRQAVRQAVKQNLPLEQFTRLDDYQKWEWRELNRPRAGALFAQLTIPARLMKWVDSLKTNLPDFVFAVSEFGLMPRLDKDGNPRLDEQGNALMYRRRLQTNIVHLSGLFMSDYDHLPFDPRELHVRATAPGFPWKVRLSHLTSSGEGLRLVSECIPSAGNIADNQYLQAKELGMLNVIGTTGKFVTDNSCVNADKLSFCPRLEDILYIDEDNLFHY